MKQIEDEASDKCDTLEEIKTVGQALLEDKRTGETWAVRETMMNCDRNWGDFQVIENISLYHTPPPPPPD